MTKNQFKKVLSVDGGQFDFSTNKHEGMIGVSPTKVFVWVDDIGFGQSEKENEPKNVGEFNSVDELLDTFKVDGEYFSDAVLPEITKLTQLYS